MTTTPPAARALYKTLHDARRKLRSRLDPSCAAATRGAANQRQAPGGFDHLYAFGAP